MTKHPKVPSLQERRAPGLSQILPQRPPDQCRNCGAVRHAAIPFTRWRECDEWDKPLVPAVFVILCASCARKLIEAHPRLYIEVPWSEPVPGQLRICADCPLRQGLVCAAAQFYGGAGVMFQYDRAPTVMFVDGVHPVTRKRTGWKQTDYGNVLRCAQKEGVAPGERAEWPPVAGKPLPPQG